MKNLDLVIFLVGTALLSQGPASAGVNVSDLTAKSECPVAIAHYQGGLGHEDQAGIIVAVWRDGTLVRATEPKKPWAAHVVGTLDEKDRQALGAILDHGDIWGAPRGEVGLDQPQEWLVLQHGDRRWAWWESPGVTRTRELQDTVLKLLRFHVRSATDLVGSFERRWECMDGRLEHETAPGGTRPGA